MGAPSDATATARQASENSCQAAASGGGSAAVAQQQLEFTQQQLEMKQALQEMQRISSTDNSDQPIAGQMQGDSGDGEEDEERRKEMVAEQLKKINVEPRGDPATLPLSVTPEDTAAEKLKEDAMRGHLQSIAETFQR